MKFCIHCGAQVSENVAFCGKCGGKLANNTTQGAIRPTEAKIKSCPHCGAQVAENAMICHKCGCTVSNAPQYQPVHQRPQRDNTNGSGIWLVLSFVIPIVGIILYFTTKSSNPSRANKYLIIAGYGFLVWIIVILMIMYNSEHHGRLFWHRKWVNELHKKS